MGLILPWKLVIATHHKAGTAWLQAIFGKVSKQYGLEFLVCSGQEAVQDRYDVLLNYHSRFDFSPLPALFRGLHLIRDPRDIVVSSCFYHQVSGESWLHEPQEYLGGMTYQEKINSFSCFGEKLSFEMENCSRETINDIMSWDYNNPDFLEVKYEDLLRDQTLLSFRKIFIFAGFPAEIIPKLIPIVYYNSLFSPWYVNKEHIRSGQPGEWRNHFSDEHRSRFAELFPDLLIRLGYEKDNSWIG